MILYQPVVLVYQARCYGMLALWQATSGLLIFVTILFLCNKEQ